MQILAHFTDNFESSLITVLETFGSEVPLKDE